MHIRGVDVDVLRDSLNQACFAPCHRHRQSMMSTLEHMETSPGFLSTLMRVIDLEDFGKDMPSACRQLAAIIFKSTTLKFWKTDAAGYVIPAAEREEIKEFLLFYLSEPECNIASQLATLLVTLAKLEWPQQWPQLIPQLMEYISNDEEQPLISFRATMYLHSVFQELAVLPSNPTTQVFQGICVQSFHPIVRAWAKKSKWIQDYITAKHQILQGEEVLISRDHHFEIICYQGSALMRILRIILEHCLPEIIAKFQCFANFWKTYLASIQSQASFIQRIRPLCRMLVRSAQNQQHGTANNQSNQPSGPPVTVAQIEKCIAEKLCMMEEEQAEDQKDYFIARKYFTSENEGLFSLVNVVLMMLRCQNCTPVVLQRKYPMLVIPWLEPLLTFYCKHLVEEYPLSNQNSIKLDMCLPLKYLSMASTVFLCNVMNCPQYSQPPASAAVSSSHHAPSSSGATSASPASGNTHPYYIRERFFTAERIQALVERILAFLLYYSPKDLQPLFGEDVDENDSEGLEFFFQQHIARSWQDEEVFSLRNFAEKIVWGLLQLTSSQMVTCQVLATSLQSLLTYIANISKNYESTSFGQEVIRIDNVLYIVSQLAVEPLTRFMSFQPAVFMEHLLQLLLSNHHCLISSGNSERNHSMALLQVRILLLIHDWMSLLPKSSFPLVLHYILSVLQKCQHERTSRHITLIRITAMQALQRCLQESDFGFNLFLSNKENGSVVSVGAQVSQEALRLSLDLSLEVEIRSMCLQLLTELLQYMAAIDVKLHSAEANAVDAVSQSAMEILRQLTQAYYVLASQSSDILNEAFMVLVGESIQCISKFAVKYDQLVLFRELWNTMVPLVMRCLGMDPSSGHFNAEKRKKQDVKAGMHVLVQVLTHIPLCQLEGDGEATTSGNVCARIYLHFVTISHYYRNHRQCDDDDDVMEWIEVELRVLQFLLIQCGKQLLSSAVSVDVINAICVTLTNGQFRAGVAENAKDNSSCESIRSSCLHIVLMILKASNSNNAALLQQVFFEKTQFLWSSFLHDVLSSSNASSKLRSVSLLNRLLCSYPRYFLSLLHNANSTANVRDSVLQYIQLLVATFQSNAFLQDIQNRDFVLQTRFFLLTICSLIPTNSNDKVWRDIWLAEDAANFLLPTLLNSVVWYCALVRKCRQSTLGTAWLKMLAGQYRSQLFMSEESSDALGIDAGNITAEEVYGQLKHVASYSANVASMADVIGDTLSAFLFSHAEEEEMQNALQIMAQNLYHNTEIDRDHKVVVEVEDVIQVLYRRQMLSTEEAGCYLVGEVVRETLQQCRDAIVGSEKYDQVLYAVQKQLVGVVGLQK